MDYSDSERELAEELDTAKVRINDLEIQVVELSASVDNLSSQLGKLTKVVRVLASDKSAQTREVLKSAADSPASPGPTGSDTGANTASSAVASTSPPPADVRIPGELLVALKLVGENRSEEAHKKIMALPRELLVANPGIVAIIAGAVRISKGEYEIARGALAKARTLINEPKLQRMIELLESRMSG